MAECVMRVYVCVHVVQSDPISEDKITAFLQHCGDDGKDRIINRINEETVTTRFPDAREMAEQHWHTKQKIKKTIKAQLGETKSQQQEQKHSHTDRQRAWRALSGSVVEFP